MLSYHNIDFVEKLICATQRYTLTNLKWPVVGWTTVPLGPPRT